uniref:ATP synthase F1F0 subunit B n=1 Tax=Cavernulicola chilensis TaxID=3028028 RepID=A0A7H0WB83_9RHOD|nr:ATP synthase F1F0 subunit B [Cavernulicola chilensis]QNR39812.1 ATP synthase F1F0 subunit B [Cavernulicola chilensis]
MSTIRNWDISYIFLGLALLCSTRVILLNEESLVLICFVTLVYLAITRLGGNVSKELDQRSSKIASDLDNSLYEVESQLRQDASFHSSEGNLESQVSFLKRFCYLNTEALSRMVHANATAMVEIRFPKKLQTILEAEGQVNTLLRLLFCLELDRIVEINKFYSQAEVARYKIMNQLINQERIILI